MPNYGAYGSVFDWTTGVYRVYQLPNPPMMMTDASPCQPAARPTKIGVDINAALCALPAGAQYIGTSDKAVGTVMRTWGASPAPIGAAPTTAFGLGGVRLSPYEYESTAGNGLGQAPGLGALGALGQAIGVTVLVNVIAAIVTPKVLGIFK